MFYGAVVLFFLASYVAVLYALGYKYSFSENRFQRTGAIFLKSNESAKVFADDELVDSTSFLTNTLGIDGLLPGQYVIRLQKDGYSSWQKTVTVQEGLVTDFTKILLLPQDEEKLAQVMLEIEEIFSSVSGQVVFAPSPTPKPRRPSPSPNPSPAEPFYIKDGALWQSAEQEPLKLGDKVLGFSVSENENRILWWTRNELWVRWLEDTDYQPHKKQGDQELISRFASPIRQAGWFRDKDHVVVDSNGYRIVETDTRGGINIIKI